MRMDKCIYTLLGVGEIVEDEHDDQPFNVRNAAGKTYWYREEDIELANSGQVRPVN